MDANEKLQLKLALLLLRRMVCYVNPDAMFLAISATAKEAGIDNADARRVFAPLILTQQESQRNKMFGWQEKEC